ncbi:SymE family type I addiction module toxin [Providencia vermicola]|uniref:SymE family type I addiction module toxin n=1 Tax=Providencia TaxID=586 RepID=UPI0023499509|nr:MULTISPECIES: SymE family type I addiction module toxin [Providencia]
MHFLVWTRTPRRAFFGITVQVSTISFRNVKTPTAKDEVVKTRQYTVGYAPNRGKPNPSPQLTLSGKWLNELGFTVGSHFTLTRQAGQLIIRLAEE